MHTYQFTINGLRHHDYADCLEQLFLVAVGQPVMLCLEPDNAHDPDAVIAYLGHACLGYVRITQRAEACALIRAQGGDSLLGCVVAVDRSHRWIIVEIVADGSLPPLPEGERLTLLADWCYDGRVLGEDEPEHRLHVMLECLLRAVGQDQPWDRYAEAWLEYVEQELWRDISRENWEQVTRLLSLLTAGATRQPAYADKALRLQLAIERMGSPEVRRRQVRHILEDAHSSRMTLLLCHYGLDAAKALLQQLPAELGRLFLHDSELLMGRLWYLHLPRRQTHALLTLLSLLVRISGEFPAPAQSDDDAEGADERSNNLKLCDSVSPCSANNVAARIAKGCKTKLLVILNAVYHAGWLTDAQDRPLTNRDKALNDILRLAFGEEKPVAVRNLIWPSRNADNPKRQRKILTELLESVQEED